MNSHEFTYDELEQDKDGYVYDNKNAKVARVEGEDYLKAGSAFLLLINELR